MRWGNLSIVIPAHNEEGSIEKMVKRIEETLFISDPYEVIFVDDGSTDGTWDEIVRMNTAKPNVRGISFSRNFGKEAAILAGLENAKGSCVAVIDCDLQHPPEMIDKMYTLWHKGYDVVEGIKKERGKESIFHKLFASLFYSAISKSVKADMNNTSDFKLLDRRVVLEILRMKESSPFFRAQSAWVGFKKGYVEYEVAEREDGESKWSFSSLFRYAVQNITSYTAFPLIFPIILGMILLIAGVGSIITLLVLKSTSIILAMLSMFLVNGGILFLVLGVMGYYLARVYREALNRPRYIVEKTT